uniref:42kDa chitin-binding protein n=1 Tax=Solanum tuberosum TaxID=4113 RepID=M0ZJ00_SOLTU
MRGSAICVLVVLGLFVLRVSGDNVEEVGQAERECRAGVKECPEDECCSIWGWCGVTERYCGHDFCQSQCLIQTNNNRMRGIQSFFNK